MNGTHPLPPKRMATDDLIAGTTASSQTRTRTSSHHRKASFSPEEEFFLRGLLLDDHPDPHTKPLNGNHDAHAELVLNDDILFSVPLPALPPKGSLVPTCSSSSGAVPPKARRPSTLGLWKAHQYGVSPVALARKGALTFPPPPKLDQLIHPQRKEDLERDHSGTDDEEIEYDGSSDSDQDEHLEQSTRRLDGNDTVGNAHRPSTRALRKPGQEGDSSSKMTHKSALTFHPPPKLDELIQTLRKEDLERDREEKRGEGGVDDVSSIPSDQEVRKPDKDDLSECSSWDETEHVQHYNTWRVLDDEYAKDFGFDFSESVLAEDDFEDNDDQKNNFLILGTSAEDVSAHPQVLSPPLMDSLMTFLPQNLQDTNFWLKFSLVRDGAALSTLKTYCRASSYTILAIETPRGEVFGSFTSSPWQTHRSYYGNAPSFVWKMRHSRRTPCVSLYDQAQLESTIDVYAYEGSDEYIQACKHDSLALGGDERHAPTSMCSDLSDDDSVSPRKNNGFAIALEEDLLRGTTSPCNTFASPSLCGSHRDRTQLFEVANVEVWTFTSCRDVSMAERLEMTRYFATESSRGSLLSSPGSSTYDSGTPQFSSRDLIQERFYQRVGHDPASEERRQRWQYANMMGGVGTTNRGMGSTPRFGYSS
jgi:hypothetical protein